MLPRNSVVDFTATASSMDVADLLGEDFSQSQEQVLVEAAPVTTKTTTEANSAPVPDLGQKELAIPEDADPQPKNTPAPLKALAPAPEKVLAAPRALADDDLLDADVDEYEDEEEEAMPTSFPDIQTITQLSKHLRTQGMKFSVFNIKGTLIRYLEMFGERKVARHVLDQDSHAFYEIHAGYVPGGAMYSLLTRLGFKPLHPTDLDDDYHKDMSYDVAMSNGKLFINVFGGLQQHAPTEETVIRNLYASERMRYSQQTGAVSLSGTLEDAEEKVSKNLMLASMQSFALGKPGISWEFFGEAMASAGIDSLMSSMTENQGLDDELQPEPSVKPEKQFYEIFDAPSADADLLDEEEDEEIVEASVPVLDEINALRSEDALIEKLLEEDQQETDAAPEQEIAPTETNAAPATNKQVVQEIAPAEKVEASAPLVEEGGNTIFDRAPRFVEPSDVIAQKAMNSDTDEVTDLERAAANPAAELSII